MSTTPPGPRSSRAPRRPAVPARDRRATSAPRPTRPPSHQASANEQRDTSAGASACPDDAARRAARRGCPAGPRSPPAPGMGCRRRRHRRSATDRGRCSDTATARQSATPGRRHPGAGASLPRPMASSRGTDAASAQMPTLPPSRRQMYAALRAPPMTAPTSEALPCPGRAPCSGFSEVHVGVVQDMDQPSTDDGSRDGAQQHEADVIESESRSERLHAAERPTPRGTRAGPPRAPGHPSAAACHRSTPGDRTTARIRPLMLRTRRRDRGAVMPGAVHSGRRRRRVAQSAATTVPPAVTVPASSSVAVTPRRLARTPPGCCRWVWHPRTPWCRRSSPGRAGHRAPSVG